MTFSDDLAALGLKSDQVAFAAAMKKWDSLTASQRRFAEQWWETRADKSVPLSIDMMNRLFLKVMTPARRR